MIIRDQFLVMGYLSKAYIEQLCSDHGISVNDYNYHVCSIHTIKNEPYRFVAEVHFKDSYNNNCIYRKIIGISSLFQILGQMTDYLDEQGRPWECKEMDIRHYQNSRLQICGHVMVYFPSITMILVGTNDKWPYLGRKVVYVNKIKRFLYQDAFLIQYVYLPFNRTAIDEREYESQYVRSYRVYCGVGSSEVLDFRTFKERFMDGREKRAFKGIFGISLDKK